MPPCDDPDPSDVAAAYDDLADEYEAVAERQAHNAHLEFPATTGLIPDVDGGRVLDAGCGAGRYVEWLTERGGEVVGVDGSQEMVARTRQRVDGSVAVVRADLAAGLPFVTAAFDGVVSAVVLDYVEDWRGLFGEFARVLRPGGFVVVSVAHPFSASNREAMDDYHDVELREPDFETGVPFYRRPLEELLDPLLAAGFRLDELVEPEPTAAFRDAAPEAYEAAAREPVYIGVRARLESAGRV